MSLYFFTMKNEKNKVETKGTKKNHKTLIDKSYFSVVLYN